MSTTTPASSWTVQVVSQDEIGVAFYLDCYRPFRLKMLRLAPEAFSSTVSRESAFDEEFWRRRLLDPLTKTFVATRVDSPVTIDSALTLRGPFYHAKDEPSSLPTSINVSEASRWDIHAVFTSPEVRRLGIGAAVLENAIQYAVKQSAASGSDCLLKLGVSSENPAGRALYEKAGFKFVEAVDDKYLSFERLIKQEKSLETV